jgi:hypothetical protein
MDSAFPFALLQNYLESVLTALMATTSAMESAIKFATLIMQMKTA